MLGYDTSVSSAHGDGVLEGIRTYSEKNGIAVSVPDEGSKLGIAISTIGKLPINGLRCSPDNGTNGWYIWCGGEITSDDDFFSPLHVEHIEDYLPQVKPYLDLPPGYRFLIDGERYEDVWYDDSLLS